MISVSALPGRCGAESSSPVPAPCLYPWAKPPHQGKPSPSLLLVPRLITAAAFNKATLHLRPTCSPPSLTSPAWDNGPSPPPPPLLLWMDTVVSCWKCRFHHHQMIHYKLYEHLLIEFTMQDIQLSVFVIVYIYTLVLRFYFVSYTQS